MKIRNNLYSRKEYLQCIRISNELFQWQQNVYYKKKDLILCDKI